MAKPIYILNGPNLNLLGTREPQVYGTETLADLEQRCVRKAEALGLAVDFRQSNAESELVDWIQEARAEGAGLIVNAGAYSHTSIAMLDALLACDVPIVEVHLIEYLHARTIPPPILYFRRREGGNLRLRWPRLRTCDRGSGLRDFRCA